VADRAIVFIDGNNWYHSLRDAGVPNLMDLSYSKISEKLLGPREWVGTRYYIGALKQEGNKQLYADQRRFLSLIRADDSRISVHLGRIEKRLQENPLADALLHALHSGELSLSDADAVRLRDLAQAYRQVLVPKEKAVDILMAVDIVEMAIADKFDAAYLLTADGDFTPAVESVRSRDKKVYVASPSFSSQLNKVANSFIPLKANWLADCFR
jgi:uncharacterized LabA/DUF88 family protein